VIYNSLCTDAKCATKFVYLRNSAIPWWPLSPFPSFSVFGVFDSSPFPSHIYPSIQSELPPFQNIYPVFQREPPAFQYI
jgi:hypothetical protein